jgi:metal-responsive CopG/Arc/MetJ family transcriptional regulator
MRTSSVVTISLPPAMAKQSATIAKKRHMTRSELMRSALRNYIEQVKHEEAQADIALREYEREKKSGKLKELKGSLVDLME